MSMNSRNNIRSLICGALLLAVAGMVSPASAINLALSGTATANSQYAPASNAIDGNFMSGWNAGDHGYPSDPNWLIVDLGNAFSVDKIVVTGWGTDGLYPGYTTDYNVYTGLTGSDWTLQLSGTFVDESAQISDRVASTDFAGSKP
jgi:hypothetical protein